MNALFSFDSLISLLTLSLLEIVLGIDNVIFVSTLIGRLPASRHLAARRIWMIAGILVRSALLLALGWLVTNGNKVLFSIGSWGFSIRHLILIGGGLFLLFKTVHEIHEKLEGGNEESAAAGEGSGRSFGGIITQLILVDTVFSFDSIITAVGLAKQVSVMITAVILSIGVMLKYAGAISDFVHHHPTLKMLALSFLLLIGVTLVAEGTHQHVNKGYIYFAMAFSFGVELLNLRLRKSAKAKPVELHQQVR